MFYYNFDFSDAPLDSILKTKVVCDTLNLAMIPYVESKNILNTTAADDENALDIPENDAVSSAASISSVPISRSTSPTLSSSSKRQGYRQISEAERPNQPSQAQKIKTLTNKLKADRLRKGNFVRIFPRKETYHLYKRIIDEQDHRYEKQDNSLYEALFDEDPDKLDVDEADIISVQKELLDARAIPTSADLSENALRFLKSALEESSAYEADKHKNGQRLYPSKFMMKFLKTLLILSFFRSFTTFNKTIKKTYSKSNNRRRG